MGIDFILMWKLGTCCTMPVTSANSSGLLLWDYSFWTPTRSRSLTSHRCYT